MKCLWLLFLSGAMLGQTNIGSWKSFTNMQSVRGLAVSNSTVTPLLLAAADGGAFQFDAQGSAPVTINNTDGLLSNNTSAAAFDASDGRWIGGVDGSLNYLPAGSTHWRSISAIRNSSFPNKQVKQLVGHGDTMFVVCGFGVLVYRIGREEFGDTYANFGFAGVPVVSCTIITANSIWVGTNLGVAVASLGAPNLSSPSAWTTFTANGLPSAVIHELAVFHDTLAVGTENGLAYFSGGSFHALPATSGKTTLHLFATGSSLYSLSNAPGILVESLPGFQDSSRIAAQRTGTVGTSLAVVEGTGTRQIFVGSTDAGVLAWNGSVWIPVTLNTPGSNLFVSLAVDGDGILWAGTGMNNGGQGFMRYNAALPPNAQWKTFRYETTPLMGTNDYYLASAAGNGRVWMSSYGRGTVEMMGDSILRKIDATTNPKLPSTDAGLFVVAGGVRADPAGLLWFVDYLPNDKQTLARLNGDNTFTFFQNGVNPFFTEFFNVTIDAFGTKWFTNSMLIKQAPVGLYYFNEALAVSGTAAAGGWGNLSTADGLPNALVNAVVEDQSGTIWVGTDLGCVILLNPRNPGSSASRQSVFALREQSCHAIAVDAVNNKWVGTREGVFVLNADGTQLLEQYRVENTDGKLVDNDIRSITIDQKRGVVYIGTEKGLSSLSIAAVESPRVFTGIDVAPNPFLIPETPQVTILNLVPNSSVKILNTNGTLVQQFKSQGGGRAFWDGRDGLGNLVGSGVYFVVAYAENGNQVASGKVAVIRR